MAELRKPNPDAIAEHLQRLDGSFSSRGGGDYLQSDKAKLLLEVAILAHAEFQHNLKLVQHPTADPDERRQASDAGRQNLQTIATAVSGIDLHPGMYHG